MTLLAKIKEAHREGLIRYEHNRRLLSSPAFLLVTAINKVIPETVKDVPSEPNPLNPLASYYRPQVEYLKGFYGALRKY